MSSLERTLGLPGAIITGIASMLGMALFTVWTPVVGQVQGLWIVVAVLIAGAIAALNAISVSRLAAALPESGGVYAYARHWLNVPIAVTAGYSFWISKTATSAAAALAIGAYVYPEQQRLVGLAAIVIALAINAMGLKRTVGFLAVSSIFVVGAVLFAAVDVVATNQIPSAATPSVVQVLTASSFLFVVFAGYARLATLGAEVRRPERNIPLAIAISMTVIAAIAVVTALAAAAVTPRGDAALASINADFSDVLAIAVVLSAGGSLISLIAGVSRTALAMATHRHAPTVLARVHQGIPQWAQAVVAAGIVIMTFVGGISFGIGLAATSILTYYSIAHIAALKAGKGRVIPTLGLVGCLLLGLWPIWVNL